jgi:FtsH-binding integral membrane protein
MNTNDINFNSNLDSPMYAESDSSARRSFITSTYVNLFLGVVAFVIANYLLIQSGLAKVIANFMYGNMWISILAAIAFGFITTFFLSFTASNNSKAVQYFGLFSFAAIEAVFVVPVIYFAASFRPALLAPAAFFTLGFFLLMTGIVYYTGIDFSFMRSFLMFAGIASIIIVVISLLTGFNLGIFFTGFLILLSCGYILYDTSNVLNNYHANQPVAAATALLGALVMLFVNILQFLMQFFDNN